MSCGQWLCILPVILAAGVPITFFLTYSIAVSKDHVYPVWPYISDTGSFPPESCVFGQILNFGAFILFFIIYLRYRQVREYAGKASTGISRWGNITSFVLGLASCLGLDIVANFQEANVITVHLLGAALCFILGTIYIVIQTVFTRKMDKNRRIIFYLRAFLSAICVCSTILAISPVYSAVKANKGGDFMHWKPEHPGYGLHMLSTTMEWILAFSFCFFFGTLFWDFRDLRITEPTVTYVDHSPGRTRPTGLIRSTSKFEQI